MSDEIFCTILLVFVMIFLGSMAYDGGVAYPIASEKAMNYCLDRGFDYAKRFDKVLFDTEPRGIECAMAEYTRYDSRDKNANVILGKIKGR